MKLDLALGNVFGVLAGERLLVEDLVVPTPDAAGVAVYADKVSAAVTGGEAGEGQELR